MSGDKPLISDLMNAMDSIFDDVDDPIKAARDENGKLPLLAHYTSLDLIEKIIRERELWFPIRYL